MGGTFSLPEHVNRILYTRWNVWLTIFTLAFHGCRLRPPLPRRSWHWGLTTCPSWHLRSISQTRLCSRRSSSASSAYFPPLAGLVCTCPGLPVLPPLSSGISRMRIKPEYAAAVISSASECVVPYVFLKYVGVSAYLQPCYSLCSPLWFSIMFVDLLSAACIGSCTFRLPQHGSMAKAVSLSVHRLDFRRPQGRNHVGGIPCCCFSSLF